MEVGREAVGFLPAQKTKFLIFPLDMLIVAILQALNFCMSMIQHC